MPITLEVLLRQYVEELQKIYGTRLKSVILYGSYARGDFEPDSDIDIMILLDLSDMEIKTYRHQLSGLTYDFNMDHELDIKPIAKSQEQFEKWQDSYPFYNNVNKEGVKLYGTA
jgi:predicted nucleotidyltransferase